MKRPPDCLKINLLQGFRVKRRGQSLTLGRLSARSGQPLLSAGFHVPPLHQPRCNFPARCSVIHKNLGAFTERRLLLQSHTAKRPNRHNQMLLFIYFFCSFGSGGF